MFIDLPFRNLSEYGIKKNMIGFGGYGSVHKYECDRSGTCVAIKTFKTFNPEEGVGLYIIREISILVKLQHPNIAKIIDVINFDKNTNNILLFMGFPGPIQSFAGRGSPPFFSLMILFSCCN